ncbi:Cytochrome P450 [Macleaya cordata]|uniref:Cytochrome P450 n=1 Tax=Macleaya cordata TaxID=56857 RepID=A0A200PLV8_MACCD|nr:Cytochrome P450 [Macleaya cordata]
MELSFDYLLWCFLALAVALIYILSFRFIKVPDPSKPPLPPGNYGWPVFGESIEILKLFRYGKGIEFFKTRMSKHNKNIFKTSLMGEKTIVFCGAAGNKHLFTSEKQSVITCWPKDFKKLFGLTKCARRDCEDWAGRDQVLALPLVKKYAFWIVCEVFTGINDSNWQSKFLKEFYILLDDEEGRLFTDEEIANNIIILMHAGHETSSSMMMVIKYLAETPECYRRVLEEQREIAMSKGRGELLNKDDLQKMKYSWNVVSEVLRLWPPVLGTFRQAIKDFTDAGFSIPKGWKIWWNPYSTHMNEEYFPDPYRFDPSRFERGAPAPYAYVPFGGGPRMCPGREFARVEILVFMHNLVWRFRWELVFPEEKISIDPMPVSPKGLPIYLYRSLLSHA